MVGSVPMVEETRQERLSRPAAVTLTAPLTAIEVLVLGAVASASLAPLVLTAGGAEGRTVALGLAAALAVYAAVAALVLRGLGPDGARRAFGWPNALTLGRVVLLAVIAGMAAVGSAQHALGWWVMGLAIAALVLDGVDGWVARRHGLASAFGARFDMEVDAALLLVLSLATVRLGQLGAWVLAIGLARYAFLAAGLVWRSLREPLPERPSRRVICVVQGGVLAGCAAPIVPLWLASLAASIALALLAWSFLADIRRLVARGEGRGP